MASAVGCSVFHLCRVFCRCFGMTMHRYQSQLRLRESLDLLASGGGTDLTELALNLGYSSHSHFTFEFRRAFGQPPSAFRGAAGACLLRRRFGQSGP